MEERNRALGLGRLLAITLITLAALFPQAVCAQEPPTHTGAYRLELAGGRVFHATDNPIHAQRQLAVPGSDLTVHVWQEELADGEMQSFQAFSHGAELRGRVRPTTHEVRLRDFRFDPLTGGSPELSFASAARADSRLYLVQLEATPLPEMRRAITRAGGKVLSFLTDHTFIVDLRPQVRAAVRQLDFVRWIGPYHAGFRLEKALRNGVDGIVAPLETQRYSILLGERGVTQSAVATRIEALGGVIELIEPGGMRVEATLSQDQLLEVAHMDEVLFIDRWGGPGETDMNIVRSVGGADYIETVEGFTGQGVRAEVFDTELHMTHQEWGLAPILHSGSNTCGGTNHGTSCYSNNFATGVDADARGIVPDAQGIFFCYGESTQFGGSTSRYPANAELINPAGPYRAVYQTSSVGSTRTFNYTTLSAETDDYLFLHQILSTQSQSNAGNQDSRPQAWSKNIVSVGGIRHGNTASRCDDYHGSSGSTGPAEDGRIKPDLSFFYDSIRSAEGSGSTSYTGFGGTSSATPQTSGYFGLLFQMWHEGVWAGHGGAADVFDSRPQMATAKALMVNNAWRYDWANAGGCSYSDADRYRQGWGTADAQRLYDRAGVTSIIDETDVITPLETISYNVTVQPGESELNVTMVYVDPAGTVGASQNRINDLSLRVTAPGGGTSYWGNNGLTAGNWSTSGGSSNTLDTVENVFIQNPAAGDWTIEVIADEIVEDAHTETGAVDADYALVVSGGQIGPSCTPAPIADAGADRWITEGDSTTIGTPAQVGTTYSWSPGGQASAEVSVSPTTTTTYTVTATTSCGSAQSSLTVTVVPPGGGPCSHAADFEGGADGWTNGADTCSTGSFVAGSPTATDWQVAGGNPGDAYYTQPNTAIGTDDVDGGTCEALSPVINCLGRAEADISLDYFHGQRDAGDDAGDGFSIEVLSDGMVVDTMVVVGDVTHAAAWTTVSTTVSNPGNIQLRVRATDAASAGDIVEGGIDNVQISPSGPICTVNADCDDGAWCNGAETCNAGACQDGTAPDCSDGVSCTDDSCNEGSDSCDNVVNNGNCDNGAWCDGAESCSATLDCQAGTAPDCSDGVACTVDSCNEGSDSCDNVANDGACDNGAFCDGAEVCNATLGCQDGPNPCTGGQTCNETTDVCEGGGGGCPAGSIDFNSLALTSYSNQNASDQTAIEDGGDTLRVTGNTWVRSTQTFNVTAGTMIDFDFTGTTQGEIHAIGFDENDDLNDLARHFQFWGTQNWTGAGRIDWNPKYTGGGSPQSYTIAVGESYTGGMWLVFTGDDDASAASDATFSCVRIYQETPPACTVDEDFESGSAGWVNEAASTCTTGDYVEGDPTNATSGWQIVGSHSGVSSLFTAVNTASGTDDVDGGNCILGSPTWAVTNASTLSVWYWHGQRDDGDDPSGGLPSGDGFALEYSTDGGASWTTMASNGDATSNPVWAEATAQVPAGSNVEVRVQCSDGASAGDLVECGIDDVSICE